MLKIHNFKRRDWITGALVVLVAGLLRFGAPDVVEFFHDEAILSILAQDMARGESFPTVGIISSVGIPNPPASVYVLAVPYLFTDNPLWVTLFIAGLNVLGVGLLWMIGHRYFSPTVALVTGLTYAVNLWAVMYSRKIWAQDYLTPFLLLGLFLGLLGFIEGKKWAQILCLPVLIFAMQIHFAAWVLLPLYLVLILTSQTKPRLMTLIISTALAILVLLPYLVGLAQILQQDPTRITDALNRSEANQRLSLSGDALQWTHLLMTGLGIEQWIAPNQQPELTAYYPVQPMLWWLIAIPIYVGLFSVWRRYRRFAWLMSLWVLMPVIVFTPTWTTVYPHYFIGALPAYALLIGIGIESLILSLKPLSTTPTLPRAVILGLFISLLATQGISWWRIMQFVDRTEITLGAGTSGYTTPLHYMLPVRDVVRDYDDVLVISDGMHVLFDVEPARWAVMLRDSLVCVRTLPGDGFALFPPREFAAIVAPNAPQGAVADLYQTEDAQIFPTRSQPYRVSHFDAAPVWSQAEIISIDPVKFTNGIALTGYAITADRIYLEWSLPAADDVDYQYFTHLLDADGQVLQQRDSSFWSGRHWCAGDRLISWQPNEVTDSAMVRIGFYTLGNEAGQYFPVDVLDTLGNPAGNWVDIQE